MASMNSQPNGTTRLQGHYTTLLIGKDNIAYISHSSSTDYQVRKSGEKYLLL